MEKNIAINAVIRDLNANQEFLLWIAKAAIIHKLFKDDIDAPNKKDPLSKKQIEEKIKIHSCKFKYLQSNEEKNQIISTCKKYLIQISDLYSNHDFIDYYLSQVKKSSNRYLGLHTSIKESLEKLGDELYSFNDPLRNATLNFKSNSPHYLKIHQYLETYQKENNQIFTTDYLINIDFIFASKLFIAVAFISLMLINLGVTNHVFSLQTGCLLLVAEILTIIMSMSIVACHGLFYPQAASLLRNSLYQRSEFSNHSNLSYISEKKIQANEKEINTPNSKYAENTKGEIKNILPPRHHRENLINLQLPEKSEKALEDSSINDNKKNDKNIKNKKVTRKNKIIPQSPEKDTTLPETINEKGKKYQLIRENKNTKNLKYVHVSQAMWRTPPRGMSDQVHKQFKNQFRDPKVTQQQRAACGIKFFDQSPSTIGVGYFKVPKAERHYRAIIESDGKSTNGHSLYVCNNYQKDKKTILSFSNNKWKKTNTEKAIQINNKM